MSATHTALLEASAPGAAGLCYLDNAATSFPKPPEVVAAVRACLDQSLTVQRSSHSAPFRGDEVLRRCRVKLARLLGARQPEEIIYAYSATDALNIAIHGMVKPGGHVLVSPLEHHSVMRPLHHLRERASVEFEALAANSDGVVDPEALRGRLRPGDAHGNGRTCAVIINWISNVSATVQPVAAIGAVCSELGVPYLVDASQATGAHPVDVAAIGCDALAQPAHKSLLSLPGLGVLYLREGFEIEPWRLGGTGYRSDLLKQPGERPMRYEAGTPNVPSIVGLDAALDWLEREGVADIERRINGMARALAQGLSAIPGVKLVGPWRKCEDAAATAGLGSCLSFTVDAPEGSPVDPLVFSQLLSVGHHISSRAGLHCAPTAHRHFGTYDRGGTVRLSPGAFTTEQDVMRVVGAVGHCALSQ